MGSNRLLFCNSAPNNPDSEMGSGARTVAHPLALKRRLATMRSLASAVDAPSSEGTWPSLREPAVHTPPQHFDEFPSFQDLQAPCARLPQVNQAGACGRQGYFQPGVRQCSRIEGRRAPVDQSRVHASQCKT